MKKNYKEIRKTQGGRRIVEWTCFGCKKTFEMYWYYGLDEITMCKQCYLKEEKTL